MEVKNISRGARGIYSTTGLVMLEPGEVREIELADGEEAGEWFEFGPFKAKPAKGGKKAAEQGDEEAAEGAAA